MKYKICVTTGTRAEYGLLRPILHEILGSKKLELNLIVAGMHLSKKHGYSIKEIQKDGFKIKSKVDMIPKGNSSYFMSKVLGEGVIRFSEIFKKIKPDINLILGDRDEAFASALAASHMNIPNAHIHGGDRTMAGIDEYIRHAITKISNIHFTATEKSKKRVICLGENPKYVFFTGSPSIDEIKNKKILTRNELKNKYDIDITGEEIILLFHPVTTQIKSSKNQIHKILNAIIKLKKQTICIMPNSDPGNFEISNALKKYSRKYSFLNVYPNLPRSDYLGLLKYGGVLIGNSSSGIIEASFFKIPVINIGIRQNNRETTKNIMNISGNSSSEISNALKTSLSKQSKNLIKTSSIYGSGNSSKKIVKILENIQLTDKLIQKQISY